MQRYSIAPQSTRKSIHPQLTPHPQTQELEHLEQEVTLTLQEIDKNLSNCNQIINDKLFPIIKRYAGSTRDVWQNVSFWKFFLEQSANVELTGYEEPNEVALKGWKNLPDALSDVELRSEEDTISQSIPAQGDNGVNDDKESGKNNIVEDKEVFDNVRSSTPQLDKLQDTYNFDTSENIVPNPPRYQTSMESDSTITQLKPTTKTIRQSINHNLKISISPTRKKRKSSILTTPRRRDSKPRSSIAQQFDSSPLLPEPPVLLSEINYSPLKLSPVPFSQLAANLGVPTSSSNDNNGNKTPNHRLSLKSDKQRFPTTPKYQSDNLMNTPMGIHLQYDSSTNDESNTSAAPPLPLPLPPSVKFPTSNSINKKKRQRSPGKQILAQYPAFSESDDSSNMGTRALSPPVTLQFATIPTLKPSQASSRTPRQAAKERVEEILKNVEDSNASDGIANESLFGDILNRGHDTNNGVTASEKIDTDLHTVLGDSSSKDATTTTNTNSTSNIGSSLNNLFQDALANFSKDDSRPHLADSSQVNNLFGDFQLVGSNSTNIQTERETHNRDERENEDRDDDRTNNTTNELGSFLNEKYKELTATLNRRNGWKKQA